MKFIDLSLPIDDGAFEVHSLKIERISHKEGIDKLNRLLMSKTLKDRLGYLLGKRIIKKDYFPDGEFLSLEIVHSPVHIGTHLDYSYHYGSKSQAREAKTVEEIPLKWCYAQGVRLNFIYKKPGEVITSQDIEKALEEINYKLKPEDIVLFYTGSDKLFGKKEYFTHYPAVDISAIDYLLDRGINIFGVDTMGIDRPYRFMIEEFLKKKDPSLLWPAHFYGRKREFVHIERLANLDKLPDKGFMVSCFPVKIKKTGAAWARVVAILEEERG